MVGTVTATMSQMAVLRKAPMKSGSFSARAKLSSPMNSGSLSPFHFQVAIYDRLGQRQQHEDGVEGQRARRP